MSGHVTLVDDEFAVLSCVRAGVYVLSSQPWSVAVEKNRVA